MRVGGGGVRLNGIFKVSHLVFFLNAHLLFFGTISNMIPRGGVRPAGDEHVSCMVWNSGKNF